MSKMLITAGGWDIFRDDVKALAGNLEADCGEETKVEFVEGPKEWHVASVVDTIFRLPEMTTSKAILGWMGELK